MELADKVVVVTGGGNGIGRALCRRFASEGAHGVVIVDRDADAVQAVAHELGDQALGLTADVAVEADIVNVVEHAETRFGPIDLFCSNAGIGGGGGVEAPDDVWHDIWAINVLAHVYAARAVLPSMLACGDGYLLNTASAAGLLTNIGNAPYTATKHAAVGLAEWLSITYGDRGIKVSCLCPQGVKTNMLMGAPGDPSTEVVLAQGAIEPEELAEAVVAGLRDERFLILPHPEVSEYVRRKAEDPDRWLAGMRRLQARIHEALG
ncbi:MAG TPA: SDR family oxidoreductase [Acidimicrobiales bacterium]|jgi:NAD(P)-dependent dehydrogenase (short-subunit alcohol dehydrogenase family)|nr:SDR family oxidoreductase [Acidimicrobiales bacterium]